MFSLRFSQDIYAVFASILFIGRALSAPLEFSELGLERRADGGIKLDFEIHKVIHNVNSDENAQKRNINAVLANKANAYIAQIQVGSNKQAISVEVDTGSSDLWFIGSNSRCRGTSSPRRLPANCAASGTYSASSSTTSKDLNQPFYIQYYGNAGASGKYYSDDITIGDVTVKSVQLGVATSSTKTVGILGIGFDTNEANGAKYPNFPDQLVSQGIISKNYYSLFLNGPTSATGSILFGGIDSSKYTGSLKSVDIKSTTELTVNLKALTLADGSSITAGYSVLLDSGATLTYLPATTADAIFSKWSGVAYDSSVGMYRGSCSIPAGSLTYKFDNGAQISVPYSNLLYQKISGTCFYGIGQMEDAILGDNFLRSAYVVFDLTDRKIWLAQAKW